MKVRIHGFELVLGTEITLDQFLTDLKKHSGERVDNQILAVTQKGGFWVGVLLTIKDVAKFMLLRKLKVTVQELEAGSSIVDVNFFLIHPETGRGLYQHYFHSASVNVFCALCKRKYLSLKRELAVKGRKETLSYVILEKPESLVELTEKLKAIKSIELEQVSYSFAERNFSPISKFATRIVERAVFTLPSNQEKVKPLVVNILKKVGLKKAFITGIDPDGREVFLKLVNDHAVFQEYDFDDFFATIDLDGSNFDSTIKGSKNVDQLIAIAKRPDVKILLESPVKP